MSFDPKLCEPRNGWILVQLIPVDQTDGGLFIPETAQGEEQRRVGCKVVKVGFGRRTDDGKLIEPLSKPGDVIYIQSRGVVTEMHADGRFAFVRDEDVVAILRREPVRGN